MSCRKDIAIRGHSIKGEDGIFLKKSTTHPLSYEGAYYSNMKTRACNPNYKKNFPTYEGVTWSKNMADFQFFVPWCRRQVGFGNHGWVLDKDLVIKGNKVYHEAACVFIPHGINGFILNNHSSRRDKNLPVGVSWSEARGKFRAGCSQLNGKNKTIGRYQNPTDAGVAYINFKNNLALDLAKIWKDKVDDRVIDTLLSYDVRDYVVAGQCAHELYNKQY